MKVIFCIDLQLLEKLINIHLSLNTLTVTYNHQDIYNWILSHMFDPGASNVVCITTINICIEYLNNLN